MRPTTYTEVAITPSVSRRDDDLALRMSILHVSERIDTVVERVAPIDDRFDLPGRESISRRVSMSALLNLAMKKPVLRRPNSPHRLFNKGDVPVHAIWFVVGRSGDHRGSE